MIGGLNFLGKRVFVNTIIIRIMRALDAPPHLSKGKNHEKKEHRGWWCIDLSGPRWVGPLIFQFIQRGPAVIIFVSDLFLSPTRKRMTCSLVSCCGLLIQQRWNSWGLIFDPKHGEACRAWSWFGIDQFPSISSHLPPFDLTIQFGLNNTQTHSQNRQKYHRPQREVLL